MCNWVCARVCVCTCVCETRSSVTRREGGGGGGGGGDNKGRGLAPRRPFIPFSREVIPIDSYWTASREPLGGETVWFVKGREDKTRPSSSPGHLLTKHHNTNQLPNGFPHLYLPIKPLNFSFYTLLFFLLSLSICLSHLSVLPPSPPPSFPPPSSDLQATCLYRWSYQLHDGPSHSGGMQGVWGGHMASVCVSVCVCVCVCVRAKKWMDGLRGNLHNIAITPATHTHMSTHTVAHSMAAFGLVSYRNQSSQGLRIIQFEPEQMQLRRRRFPHARQEYWF